MVAVPPEEDMPVTTPVDGFTVATLVVPLLHEPPLVASPSVIVVPGQTLVEPVIAAGLV